MQRRVKPAGDRKRQILEALAHQLEVNPGEHITTAGLARAVGVSEAALYRHFPSKARMFEGLIEFSEQAVFGRVASILEQHTDPAVRCEMIMGVALGFSSRNPGITRILLGEALVGEPERLRRRSEQYFNRLETQLRQVLREGRTNGGVRREIPSEVAANLLLALLAGRMRQFVHSGFELDPMKHWEQQWRLLSSSLFVDW